MVALVNLKFCCVCQQEYQPHTRPGLGLSTLPNGLAYYESVLRFHLSEPSTAQELHDLGLREVSRIYSLMVQVHPALYYDTY